MFIAGIIRTAVVFYTFTMRSCTATSCSDSNAVSNEDACYYFHADLKTWDEAQDACETNGGVLLSFNSRTEITDVLNDLRKIAKRESVGDFWVGLTNQDNGSYTWADGTALNDNEAAGKIEVDVSGGRGCVTVATSGGTFGSSSSAATLRSCRLDFAFVCEVNAATAMWTRWGAWGQCSATCGAGMKTRSRTCISAKTGTARCSGTSSEQAECQVLTCSSGATWGTWTSWGPCSVTCGLGQRSRTRSCSRSAQGVASCSGSSEAEEDCQNPSCPEWADWGSWGQCSENCGPGKRTRERSCSTGDDNDCKGSKEDTETCNQRPCSSASWEAWGEWSSCTSTCGKGTRSRTRSCSQKDGTPSSDCKGLQSTAANCITQCTGLSKVDFVEAVQSSMDAETARKAMAWAKGTSKQKENVFNTKGLKDWIITGHMIQTFKVSSKVRCAVKCLNVGTCGSFNYESQADESGLHTCQLNSASSDVASESLERKKGYSFYDYSMFFPFQINSD